MLTEADENPSEMSFVKDAENVTLPETHIDGAANLKLKSFTDIVIK